MSAYLNLINLCLRRVIYLNFLWFLTGSVYGLSADEVQTYNFAGSVLNTPAVLGNYPINESKVTENTKFESSLLRSDPNLNKRDFIQMNNGFVNLSDDTRVWITPSGAALSVKY